MHRQQEGHRPLRPSEEVILSDMVRTLTPRVSVDPPYSPAPLYSYRTPLQVHNMAGLTSHLRGTIAANR